MLAQTPTQFNDADAQLVVNALTTFVKVHQALLNVVIGKSGLLKLLPPPIALFSEPVRKALVALEAGVDVGIFRVCVRPGG